MKKNYFALIIIVLLLSLGLFLRLHWWPDYLTFGYEQARDALTAKNIFIEKKLTLLGPTTEIEGIFHGPIYYYLIGAIYFLGGNNPANIGLLHLLINLTAIPIIFFVGKKLFNQKIGILAAVIFTFSYEVISYSFWLSNPSPALPLIILTYFFLYKSFKKNYHYLPLAVFFLAVSTSFDLIIIMNIFGAIILYFIYNQQKIPWKTWLLAFFSFVIPLINYPFFEARHKFLMTNTFLNVLKAQDSQFKTIFQYLGTYFNGLAKEFANLFFPLHGFFAGIIMFFLLYYLWQKLKQKKIKETPWPLITVWLFSNLPTFLIIAAVTNSEFSYFGVNAAASLLLAAFLNELLEKRKSLLAASLLLIIVLANLYAWQNYLPNPQKRLFDSQRGVMLKNSLATIDYTYQEALGKPFFVDKVTVPLFVSPLWDYLYSWYGKQKYGYLPTKDTNTNKQFLIIEPGWGLTYEIYKQKARENLEKKTVLEEPREFGMISVEKRKLR
ncbi:MAG: glycosyltransferase family 39 protein [Patescibacteria group bacterium]|nr:glycosyltransferase family 39 protein [Patescibacteria group bacterium]